MILKPNIIEAVNSLVSAKQRSILALIGIVVGIGSVIAMVSVGTIVQQEALRQFMEMGTDVITISESFSRGGQGKGRKKTLTLDVAQGIPAGCPGIRQVAPYSSTYETLKFQGKKESLPALGVTSAFMEINKLKMKEGRFIHDLDRHMFFCVIGARVEKMLRSLGVRELVGTRIFYKEKVLSIIGVVEEVPMGGMRPYEINQGILVPVSTIQRLFRDAEIKNVLGRTHGNLPHDVIEGQVKSYFKRHDSIAVDVRSAEELINQMQKQMRIEI